MSENDQYPIKEVKLDVWTKKVNATSMFTIPAEDEALPVLKELDIMLNRLLTQPLDDTLHESTVQYFFVNVFPVVCQKIIRSRYFKSKQVLRLANCILKNCVYLVEHYWEVGIKYPKFLQILQVVFSTDEYYFKSNDQLSYYHFPYSYFHEKQSIGETLQVGDLVDVLKIDSLFDKVTWSQGKVIKVFDAQLQIAYLYDWNDHSTKLRKDSPQLAQYNTKSKQNFEWRFSLKQGDVLDCSEMYGNWYNSTVTGIIEGQNNKKKVKVIFRVYNPAGNRTDDNDKSYFGSFSTDEQEIDITSPKIAPFCTVAKEFNYQSSKSSYDIVDDMNDYEFVQANGSKIYAIPRKRYLSSLLFQAINGFGQAGGFDKIMAYLEEETNYDLFCYFAKGINGISVLLHRKFIHEIVPKLKKLVHKYIFDDPDKMEKNFTKDKSEMIFSGLRALQKRICSNDIVYRFENQIKMKLVEASLDNKLTQKLQGLNELKDIVKNGSYVTEKNRQIKNWVKQNKIFEKIYIVNSHAQLIKKSEDFFKYLITESILEVSDLQRLYKIAQKSDFQTRISLYKLFQEVAYIFKKNHVEFLIDTILQSELVLIRNEDIDLLHELSRFSNYFPLDKVINFFESIILSTSTSSNKISQVTNYAIKRYSDIVVRNTEMKPRRRTIIRNFLDKMHTHDISQITKILKAIFEGIGIGEWGKKDLYEILGDEKIDQTCINGLRKSKQNQPDKFDNMFKEMLGFLLGIYKLSYKIKIHVSKLSQIWDLISGNPQNENIYFKWINEQFDKCQQGLECDSYKTFELYYRKIFTLQRIKNMNGLQFEVAKNFFIEVNKKTKILSVTNCIRNNVTEKQYKRKVEMKELKLIDILIQMIFYIEDQDISDKILLLFVELYNSRQNTQEEIDAFLNELLKDLKQYYEKNEYQYINKIFKLLEVVINDSQKNVDVNVDSLLRKKNKKEKVKFMIINQLYYASENVKKIDMLLQMTMTVMDLRKKIAQKYDLTWQEIRITSSREIPDHQNSKTLQEIQLNPNTPLTITKRIIYMTEPEGQLIIGNQLSPKAVRCFTRIFEKYSTNGLMDKDQCNSFTGVCLGSSSSKRHYSQKIAGLYGTYDDDNDGFLTLENFLRFYKDAAEDRPITVWSNIRNFGVRGNFRFKDDPEEKNGTVTKFPRITLSESKQFYQILFSLLKIKQCSSLAYQLLERLPVYEEILQKILTINNQEVIREIINCSDQYQLYYKLNIIQYLVNSDDLKTEKQKQFHKKFLDNHGYEQIYQLSKQINISDLSAEQSERDTQIDINQYLLYTCLSLLRNFWTQYFSEKEKNTKLRDSMALLISDYEISDKVQYLATGVFPQQQQKLQIVKGIQNIDTLQSYQWGSQSTEKMCEVVLLRLQELWKIYNSQNIKLSTINNPIIKEKLTTTLYLLSLLMSKTIEIINVLFINRYQMANMLVKKLLSLLQNFLSTKINTEIYSLIFCQCFYSDRSSSSSSIQSAYIRQLFRFLTKSNMLTTDFFLVLAVLVSIFGIQGGEEKNEEVQKMKDILFDNILNSNNELTIEGCAQLLCNFQITNVQYEKFQNLWDNRLFNPKTIVTRQQTKNMIYQLVLKICDFNPDQTNKIIQKVRSTIETQSTKMKITYCNEFKQRSVTDHSGLKNLGNICYMNSMLQQIYMNKTFRYLLLRINDYKQHTNTEIFDQKQESLRIVDDNLLHQTQKIFTYLEKTTRIDYAPKDFCIAYKPFGEPVNIMMQQDVQEFISMFFDRLQSFIHETPFRNIVQDFYSGKTANLFKCHNCRQSKKVEENFHCLTLEIKNAKTLEESFVRFTTGEQINDYTCDFCHKKVDVEKKTVISKAPKILLIHLQRIDFNLDTFVNEKLSTKHSFPQEFNLFPYTLQSIQRMAKKEIDQNKKQSQGEQSAEKADQSGPDSMNEKEKSELEETPKKQEEKQKSEQDEHSYELTGIVCHSGHAEAGHYISYIKTQENKWLQFNDSLVTYFNPANIESECFGGVLATTSVYDEDYDWDNKRETCKCAYMVIYQRKNIRKQDTLFSLVFDEKTKVTDREQFLKQYELTEVIEKLKDEQNSSLKDKNTIKDKVNQDSEIDTGDNKTSEINKAESQDDSSDLHEDSERQLLAAKEIQIRRHQSEDNVDTMENQEMQPKDEDKTIVLIDTTKLTPYNSPEILDEVSQDNHIHFLEKCLSSSGFSKFFAQLVSKPHKLQQQLLPLCQKLTFGFWLKSPSFKQLLEMLDSMIKVQPKAFEVMITENKTIINLLIEYSDTDVRTNMVAFLSKAIFDVIKSNADFSFSNKEEPIIKFLDHLLSLLPSTVTKCWTKFSQYFEFWNQLTQGPPLLTMFLLDREIIKHFMDYYLDTKSPLKIYAKKKENSIGSSYASPNFSFLLKCVSHLIMNKAIKYQEMNQSSEITHEVNIYKMTPDEQLLLISCETLEKLISENYEHIAGVLAKIICPNNLYATERVAFVILKGISKSNYDSIQPYLEVLHEFLLIDDQYQQLRLKWILGKQTLSVSVYAKKITAMNAYTIDQRLYNFDSALHTQTGASLLDHLFIQHKKMENFSMLCLRAVLKLCENSKFIRNYVYSLSSPTLSMVKYVDFFKDFINKTSGYYGYYSAAFNKEQLSKQLKILHEKVLKLVEEDSPQQEKQLKIQKKDQQATEENKEEKQEKKEKEQIVVEEEEKKQVNEKTEEQRNEKNQQMIKKDSEKEEDDNYSFKGQNNSNAEDREFQNEDLPDLENYPKSKDSDQQPLSAAAKQEKRRKARENRTKADYEINIIQAEVDQFLTESLDFSSEEDASLKHKQSEEKQQGKGKQTEYKQVYHPIIFEYVPSKEITMDENMVSPENVHRSDCSLKDITITYHQSIVTFGVTKPTGNSNKMVQMGLNGNKIMERLYPQVMENTKVETVSGFFVKNNTNSYLRIETDDGCSYCRNLESLWVWSKQIKRVWFSERFYDFPKWSLHERKQQPKN